jgi:hypothetical protein
VDGGELAASDLVQHGLARDPERVGGVAERRRDEGDRVLVGAARVAPGARQRHRVLGDRAALPHDAQLGGVLFALAVDGHDDVGEDRAQPLFALAVAGSWRVEDCAQVRAGTPAPRDLLVIERVGALGGDLGHDALGATDVGEALLPFAFQRAGDEPVVRFAGVELLAAGALGVDLRALELKLGRAHLRSTV